MKKLKVYKNPDFRLIDVYVETANGVVPPSKTMEKPDVEGGGDQPPVDVFEAPAFRNGIWDED